jgi:hypothetical protein
MEAAAITGDVINSSSLNVVQRNELLAVLKTSLENCRNFLPDFKPEIFQGDSFQGFTTQATPHSLKTGIYLICQFLKAGFGLRISLGIGEISFPTGSSLTSDGSAFLQSGRNMDLLKKKEWQLAVNVADEKIQQEWDVHNATLNYLLEKCTAPQAEAMVQTLEGQTQQQAAESLGVKQPAIQQRLQAAGWPLLQTILHRFEMQF